MIPSRSGFFLKKVVESVLQVLLLLLLLLYLNNQPTNFNNLKIEIDYKIQKLKVKRINIYYITRAGKRVRRYVGWGKVYFIDSQEINTKNIYSGKVKRCRPKLMDRRDLRR